VSCRYSAGLAVSPYQKGRLLLVSADKPPAVGCNLFESVDGGRHWLSITDEIADAVLSLTGYESCLFDRTPVVMFVPGERLHAAAMVCTGNMLMPASAIFNTHTHNTQQNSSCLQCDGNIHSECHA